MPVWAHTTQASALLPLCADCLCSKCWRFMAELTCPTLAHNKHPTPIQLHSVYRFNKTTHTQPFNRTTQVGRYQKKTFTHSHPSWSSDILYQLPPSTTIHSILFVQFTCLTDLFHNLFPGLFGLRPSTSYSMHFFTQSSSTKQTSRIFPDNFRKHFNKIPKFSCCFGLLFIIQQAMH